MVNWKDILPGGCGGGRCGCLSDQEQATVITHEGTILKLTQNKDDGAIQAVANWAEGADNTVMEAREPAGELRYIHPSEIQGVLKLIVAS